MSKKTQVVVLGAGYAGVMAANRVVGNGNISGEVEVTVINPIADFVERIRLHEVVATNRPSAFVPMKSLLHQRAVVVEDSATRIDPVRREVHFASRSEPLEYDLLLYAVGSRGAAQGGSDSVYGVQDTVSAERLRKRLLELTANDSVTIVGGGFTGIETAAEIAEKYPELHLRLLSKGRIGANLSASGQKILLNRLSALDVEVVEDTTVERCDNISITTDGGITLKSDCTIWTAGFAVPRLATDSGLPTDTEGRLLVDETLCCPDYPEIFGAGDAVHAPESVAGHLRMGCAAALPLGAHAADSIIARVENRTPTSLSIGFVVQCISLGRDYGLIQLVHADDRPRPVIVRARLGGLVKEKVCRLTVSWLRNEFRQNGSYHWPKGPHRSES